MREQNRPLEELPQIGQHLIDAQASPHHAIGDAVDRGHLGRNWHLWIDQIVEAGHLPGCLESDGSNLDDTRSDRTATRGL